VPTDLDHNLTLPATGDAHGDLSMLPAASAGRPGMGELRTLARPTGQVVALELAGLVSALVVEMDRAIQLALAEGPRGVVCDVAGGLDGAEPGAVEMLATAGRHVRDWPGIPVAVACLDPRVREMLNTHPLGRHLIVTGSRSTAITAVFSTPDLVVERLRLDACPTSPRAARSFITRVLKDWQLERVIPSASVVASRLVAGSSLNAGTPIDLSVAWNADTLRLTVADHGPAMASQRPPHPVLQGQMLKVAVGALSRTYGVLPKADGGKVVWAVFDARQERRSTSSRMRKAQGEPLTSDGVIELARPNPAIDSP
jgi:hypothetical protein